MKTKVATLVVILMSLAALPLPADEPAPDSAQVELKMKEIELDIALKQFEKIAAAVAEAFLEFRLIDKQNLSEPQVKVQEDNVDKKMERFQILKDNLQAQIRQKGAEIEVLRRKWAIPAAALEKK